jgi:hypothetical protein
MTRIFLTLAICSTGTLVAALWLGLAVGDASSRSAAVQSRVAVHFLTGVAALVFAVLVHALVITYFMGTGRWLEETCAAYRLGDLRQIGSRNLKWRLYPAMAGSLLLLIVTGASGGAADPASAVAFKGWGSLTAAHVHLAIASLALAVNVAVNIAEYVALLRNGRIVNGVLQDVKRIRMERGLDVVK